MLVHYGIMSMAERCMQLTDALAGEILRRQQLEAENAVVRAQLAANGQSADAVIENAALRAQVQDLTMKMEAMSYRLHQLTRRVFGRSSEGHHPDQQQLDEIMRQILVETTLTPDDSTTPTPTSILIESTPSCQTAAPAVGAAPSAPQGRSPATKPRAKRRGRMALPDSLPITDRLMEVPESERLGPDGTPLPQIGTRISLETRLLPRLGSGVCDLSIPSAARLSVTSSGLWPLPCPASFRKGSPTDETVAAVLVEKYDFHSPLYRQETKWERAGIDLGRSTLMNWVRHGAEALAPIGKAIGASILTNPVIGLDDTWIRVLDPGAGKTHQSRLWGYYANNEFFCEYRRTRKVSGPRGDSWPPMRGPSWLMLMPGITTALFESPSRTAAACMAHARRKFEEAFDAGEFAARQAMDLFSLLYRIEAELRLATPDIRRARRQVEGVPILNHLEKLRPLG